MLANSAWWCETFDAGLDGVCRREAGLSLVAAAANGNTAACTPAMESARPQEAFVTAIVINRIRATGNCAVHELTDNRCHHVFVVPPTLPRPRDAQQLPGVLVQMRMWCLQGVPLASYAVDSPVSGGSPSRSLNASMRQIIKTWYAQRCHAGEGNQESNRFIASCCARSSLPIIYMSCKCRRVAAKHTSYVAAAGSAVSAATLQPTHSTTAKQPSR